MFSKKISKLLVFISFLSITTSCASNSGSNLKEDLNKKNSAEVKFIKECQGYFDQAQYKYEEDSYTNTPDTKILITRNKDILRISSSRPNNTFPLGNCKYEKIGKLNKNFKFDICDSDFKLQYFDCKSSLLRPPYTSKYTSYFEIEGEKLIQYFKKKGNNYTSTTKLIKI